jgi:hypothetical protein
VKTGEKYMVDTHPAGKCRLRFNAVAISHLLGSVSQDQHEQELFKVIDELFRQLK